MLLQQLETIAAATEVTDTAKMEVLMKFVYKCSVYIGDLLRYKELYSTKEKKDYGESLKHYERAAILMPDVGNAQNHVRSRCSVDCSL